MKFSKISNAFEILDAIAAKDPKKASELMEAHLLAAEQRFVDTVVY